MNDQEAVHTGRMVGPIQLPTKYIAAGALFHTGQVFLWGENRSLLARLYYQYLRRLPLIEQDTNWLLFDASKRASPVAVETKQTLQARIKASGHYHSEIDDPRSNT